MPRKSRGIQAGHYYHILNRSVDRRALFKKPGDFEAFLRVLQEGLLLVRLPILEFCIMLNHWHFVVFAEYDEQVAEFFHWVTTTHAQRYRTHYETVGEGHIYQSRFKSFPIETEDYLINVLRYVARNPLRANRVDRAEDWKWSSLWQWNNGVSEEVLLADWPIARPDHWLDFVNQPQSETEVSAIRTSVQRGAPYGREEWVQKTAKQLNLESTLRPVGRSKTSSAS